MANPNSPLVQRRRYAQRMDEAKDLLGNKCALCGSTKDLEFDHIDRSTKSFTISTWIARKRWSAILQELAKCQLLCRDCHERKSLDEQGGPAKHGSLTTYSHHHCRCVPCKKAWNEATLRYKAAARNKRKASIHRTENLGITDN
jgi:hypothetical protein